MRKYDSYKDSGVEWIGEIPFDWNITRSKYYFENRVEKNNEDEPLLSVTQNKSVVRRDELETNVWNPDSDISGYKLIKKGDFVISLRTFEGGIELSEIQGIVSPVYSVLKLKKEVNRRYYKHLFKSNTFITELNKVTTGIRQGKNISFDDFSNISIPVPSINEQSSIGRYLDNKTSLIDSLIEKTQRKIELLKEKRTSLINEVVTKGLNPNVEMKDSGVEWIGEIPSHWEKKRLKHITKSINGYSFKSDDFDREFDIPVLRIGDVGDEIDFENCVKVKSHFLEEKKEFRVKKDDILIGLTGGTIGKSGKYNYDFPSLLNQRVGLLRNKESVLNGLLYHYVKSEVFIRYIFFDCYGGGQDNISMNDILNMVFPYPPLPEQNEIVSYLDEHTQLIDKTISIEEKRIELLKEYRQSLISEVVTGKRKVVD